MNRLNLWVVILGLLCLAVVTLSEKSEQPDILLKIGQGASGIKVLREGEEKTTLRSQIRAETNSSTSLEECNANNDKGCCFQFTWPGPHFDNGQDFHGGKFSCPVYLENYHSKEPCISPAVSNNGNRPTFEYNCIGAECNIFCRKTSCVKYSYFQNTEDGTSIWNETRFCGNVYSSKTGKQLQKGCFKEKMGSYTREVCVCQGRLCNSSPSLISGQSSLIFWSLFIFISWIIS